MWDLGFSYFYVQHSNANGHRITNKLSSVIPSEVRVAMAHLFLPRSLRSLSLRPVRKTPAFVAPPKRRCHPEERLSVEREGRRRTRRRISTAESWLDPIHQRLQRTVCVLVAARFLAGAKELRPRTFARNAYGPSRFVCSQWRMAHGPQQRIQESPILYAQAQVFFLEHAHIRRLEELV
jgi:hypothetical protein